MNYCNKNLMVNDSKLVSIIVPVYNVEKYLNRCLDGMVKQTYKNIEIILIDDGSKDNSGIICDEYKEFDDRIKVIHKDNTGVSDSRNAGLNIAKGHYITFVDSDDYISEMYVEVLVNALEENDCDIAILSAVDVDENGKILITHNKYGKTVMNREDTYIEFLREVMFQSVCWGKLYKRELVENIRFDLKMKISEDMKFLCGVLKKINKAVYIPNKEYYCLIRQNSTVRSGFDDRWNDEFNLCKEIIKQNKDTFLYEYAVKRYLRVSVACGINFDLTDTQINEIRKNIKPYISIYLKSGKVSFADKIKAILFMNSYNVLKFLYKIKR
ncbi:MAG: glycosyltransferase family 2 protein [Inconstantimicrobium porci]|uniref:glycosyltransferase family 2 protein n=1 Tax=Inconstantimicrobium porci TaxID=2652291 RepID=UPI002A90C63D|nr:glycosyltransferase family 2 protein [Inconstantimicrobium porci]MDY5912888.1 glycosyltransferase family 2 protein [Inconstantimicrobium porci]